MVMHKYVWIMCIFRLQEFHIMCYIYMMVESNFMDNQVLSPLERDS